jgi:adenine-specific DNA-methyltransferase
MDKYGLINKIKKLDGLTDEEKSALLGMLRTHKKYGLVWEDKPEAVEEDMKEKLPVLTEVKNKAIVNDTESAHYPNHILVEGDNLHALTVLSYTHCNDIDVIYIDPPYNTGNKTTGAFYYNDHFVDKEDSYKHSKWLCFMHKRLLIAKRLLKRGGIIIISIDDHEQSNLKLLCDEIFGETNMIGVLPTIMNLKGNQDEFGFAGTHEYTIVYTNSIADCVLGQLPINDDEVDNWLEDEIGYYKKGATLKRTGQDAPRENRPYGYFPILIKKSNRTISSISEEEYRQIYNPITDSFNDDYVDGLRSKYESRGYIFLLPIAENKKTSWRWGFKTVERDKNEIIVTNGRNGYSLYKKQRPELGDIPTKKPKSILYRAQYSSGNGTAQLKALGLDHKFNNPKPVDLIIDLLLISTNKESTVLDFFAGSGTTFEAVAKLNYYDKGRRQCILATDNEDPSRICENVTYPRCQKVITGYITPDGSNVSGLTHNNLRYYKTDFVCREHTVKNMRALVAAATDMLCIKEDMYQEVPAFGPWKRLPDFVARHFSDGKGGEMLIIYDEDHIEEIVDAIYNMDFKRKLKIYVFSPDRDPYTEEFEDVEDKVVLCALPAAIYDAYREVTPRPDDKEIEIAPVTEGNEEEPWNINEDEEDI